MKPPLTYYGGKQQLASRITTLIPNHKLYCEPFAGGAAVFFAKEPSELEVLNDTNGDLVNFYRVVKNDFKDLQREINTTLHSRKLHEEARVVLAYPDLFNDVKRAWAIWVVANQGYASRLDSPWGYDRKRNTTAKRIKNKRDHFTKEYAARLEQTEIENTDALRVIKSRDTPESFFYLDPPYHNASKGHYGAYTQQDFDNLLQMLSTIKGKFLFSSYPSELLSGYIKRNRWHTKVVEMPLVITARHSSNRKKAEVLTANYPISQLL